jgi:hypothetical protein
METIRDALICVTQWNYISPGFNGKYKYKVQYMIQNWKPYFSLSSILKTRGI